MKHLISSAAIGLLSALPATALAEGADYKTIQVKDTSPGSSLSRDTEFPYTYAALRYQHIDDDDLGSDGFVVEGSYLVAPNLFAIGSASTSESEDVQFGATSDSVQVNQYLLGGGYRMDLTTDFDLIATVQAVQVTAQAFGDSTDDTGYRIGTGSRGILFNMIEVGGELSYLALGGDGDAYLTVSGLYNVWSQLAAGAAVTGSQDTVAYGLTARWAF
jgi:hypothetical protein